MKCHFKEGVLHYVTHGHGKPLLILHGGYLDHRHMVDSMEPCFEKSSNWMRIYPDMPGHGQSTLANGINDHDKVLKIILEFMAQICPDQSYSVAGESRGGFLARGLAASEPELIDGLLLIVPGRYAVADSKELPSQVILERADEVIPDLLEGEIVRFNKLVVQSRAILEKIRKLKIPAIALADKEFQKRVNSNYQYSFELDNPVNKFRNPTLVILGRNDTEVGYKDALKVIENYPRATYAILDKAGHSLSWEQPELFQVLVIDWLKRVEEFM